MKNITQFFAGLGVVAALFAASTSVYAAVPTSNAGNTINQTLYRYQDWMYGVSTGFRDPDGGTVKTGVVTAQPAQGSASQNFEAIFYSPPFGAYGFTDTFYFRAIDSQGEQSAQVRFNATVSGSLDPAGYPTAGPTYLYTWKGEQGLTGAVCSGGPSNSYNAPPVASPAAGQAGFWGEAIVFTPNATFTGSTSYDYRCTSMRPADNGGNWSIASAKVNVYVSPKLAISTDEDVPKVLSLGPAAGFTYKIVSAPKNATATISGTNLTVTPKANWYGSTSLTYEVTYPNGGKSSVFTIPITVASVDSPPVASNFSVTLYKNNNLSFWPANVGTSPDGNEIVRGEIVSASIDGYFISENWVTWIPPYNYTGAATVRYRVFDSTGKVSNTATITLNILNQNSPDTYPVVADTYLYAQKDTPVVIAFYDIKVNTAPLFGPIDHFNVSMGTVEPFGGVSLFHPPAGWVGVASWDVFFAQWTGPYLNTMGKGFVTVVEPPVLSGPEDAIITSSIPGATAKYTFQIRSQPATAAGTIAISGMNFVFTPKPNWHGTTTFTYRAAYPTGQFSDDIVGTITVSDVNDIPALVAIPATLKTIESKAITIEFKVKTN